ncbi:MAG: beta-N-acetylhexosaminidase [Verrucomicrobia bacterium]|nr:beta-N-acetylhexosaminidase [Verrucomicrobiota bacterium]
MRDPVLALVPHPVRCKRLGDAVFALRATTRLIASGPLFPAAEMLAVRLRQSTGWPLPIAARRTDEAGESRIEFRQAATVLPDPEAYTLHVAAEQITITASTSAGAFYGGQTLLQLFPPAVFGGVPRPELAWHAPAIEIEDAPRFRWRGVMLDSARHFQPIDYIRKFIDLLAQHKLNVFHWHLTDDQGWRIEIKKYPRLVEVGSRRRETTKGHGKYRTEGDGLPVTGYYAQEEIRDLVAYATQRHVHILPEIEMPGHAQAAVAAYPKLGLLPKAREVSCRWGIHETLFNVKPDTLAFLQDVLAEVISLFPFDYIHIGGDEAVKTQWRQDADTQASLRQLGLRDEDHLQSWFIGQMAEFLRRHGRKLVGWDEILEGGLASGATVMSWRGAAGGIAAARLGHDAIMCPYDAVYFDYYQGGSPSVEPLAIGGDLPLHKVHAYEPAPAELPAEHARHILGVQGQLWTEYIPTTSRLDYMAFPRIAALAEVAWSPRERPPFADFVTRLCGHLRRLDCQDVRYRAPLEFLHP